MKNVEAIKYLDNMEQGGFLTIKVPISRNQYIPVTAMFVGKDKDGRYEFLDTGEMIMSNHDRYDNDILKQLTRIANSLEKIESLPYSGFIVGSESLKNNIEKTIGHIVSKED